MSESRLDYTDEEKYLFNLMTGGLKSKVLSTALKVDIFSFLSFRPRSLEEIKKFLTFPPRSLRIFLDVLLNMKLIQISNHLYENTRISNRYLVQRKLSYLGGYVDLFDLAYENNADLKEILQDGQPGIFSYGYFFEKEVKNLENIEDYSKIMNETSGELVMALSQFYDFSESELLIDIGGGIGKACMNLVSQHSGLNVILFDLPAICKNVEEKLSTFWLANKIQVCPGDFLKDEFPGGFDTALMMRIAYQWSEEQVKYLFAKVYNSLPQGGKLVIYEAFKDDDKNDPGDATMISLYLLMVSPAGECRTTGEITDWLKEVGFSSVQVINTIYVYKAIVATK